MKRTLAMAPPRRPSVVVRHCDGDGATHTAWRSRYSSGATRTSDLADIVREALLARYTPLHGSERASLEFVPFACLLAPRNTTRSLGQFTVIDSWADFGLRAMSHQLQWVCKAVPSCLEASKLTLRDVAFLSTEVPAYLVSWNPIKRDAEPCLERARFPPQLVMQETFEFFQIPYVGAAPMGASSYLSASELLGERPILAALFANAVGAERGEPVGRSPLRALLHAECQRSGHATCILGGGERGPGGTLYRNSSWILDGYRRSIFCLQPWGDTATRKGFWDAIAVGCVNVVFTQAGWNETDSWFGDHRDWTIAVPLHAAIGNRGTGANTTRVLDLLRAVPQARVRQLQANVLAVRDRLQYSIAASAPNVDAVDVIVERLSVHFARRRSRIATPTAHQNGTTLDGNTMMSPLAPLRDAAEPAPRTLVQAHRRACSALESLCRYHRTLIR